MSFSADTLKYDKIHHSPLKQTIENCVHGNTVVDLLLRMWETSWLPNEGEAIVKYWNYDLNTFFFLLQIIITNIIINNKL